MMAHAMFCTARRDRVEWRRDNSPRPLFTYWEITMKAVELRTKLESLREKLKNGKQAPVFSGKNGPIGISIIDALVQTIEEQDKRIAKLEKGAVAS